MVKYSSEPHEKSRYILKDKKQNIYAYEHSINIHYRLNINLTMGRKEDAPLFANGMPDNLTFESERKKRNAGICAILSALSSK